jgi:uncharacterized protein YecE (DUF72 family)
MTGGDLGQATRGTLFAGTSGYAYPDWSPGFYPPGTRRDALLPTYAARLPACEINNTFYRWPDEAQLRAWRDATPEAFRFALKAQRFSSFRALRDDPAPQVARLVAPLGALGSRLGTVLFRAAADVQRDDARLAALLEAWPSDVPLTLELQHPSWHVDETFAALRRRNAVLCATELPEDALPPTIRLTGPFLYLRLRCYDYTPGELTAWAARIEPFLAAGTDVYAFFRHDERGHAAELAGQLIAAVEPAAA